MDSKMFSNTYKVHVSEDAEYDFEKAVEYLVLEKRNVQAALAIADDYDETLDSLGSVAGSLKLINEEPFHSEEYRIIRFRRHRYYFVYKVEGNVAIVDRMLHELQDRNAALK